MENVCVLKWLRVKSCYYDYRAGERIDGDGESSGFYCFCTASGKSREKNKIPIIYCF